MFRPRPAYINTIKTRSTVANSCATFYKISALQTNYRNQHQGWNYHLGLASLGLMMAVGAATKSQVAHAEDDGLSFDRIDLAAVSLADTLLGRKIDEALSLIAEMEPRI